MRLDCILKGYFYGNILKQEPVFHKALPAYLSAELEQLQKRAMRIIFPFVPYSDALHQANLETLSRRRQSITTKLFNSITCNSDHKLHELLPPRNNCESNLRRKRNFNVPLAKTKRLKNTFTAISGKVVGKSARDKPERYCGWF